MNFGLNDIANKSILGTPEKDLQEFAKKFQLPSDNIISSKEIVSVEK